MGKAELFKPVLGSILRSAGAFPVRRGEGDRDALRTAVELARAGEIVAIYPEGTRREKGIKKTRKAGRHTGAARVALAAGVPLVPAAIGGTDAPLAVPARQGDLRRPDPAGRPAPTQDARRASIEATERLFNAIAELEQHAVTKPLLAVDGDSFAHRAHHALPYPSRAWRASGRARLSASRTCSCGSGSRPSRGRPCRLGHADGADLPARGVRAVPVGARVRRLAAGAARSPAGAGRSARLRRRQGARYEADDFLGAAVASEEGRGGDRARRHAPTGTCSSWRASARRCSCRGGACRTSSASGREQVRERVRRRAGAGARFHRAARRSVGQAPGRARRRAEDGGDRAQHTGPSRRRSRRALQRDRGGSSALPANRYGRRLRPSPLPRRSITNMGGGVGSCAVLGDEPAGRTAGRPGLVDLVVAPGPRRAAPDRASPRRAVALCGAARLLRRTGGVVRRPSTTSSSATTRRT